MRSRHHHHPNQQPRLRASNAWDDVPSATNLFKDSRSPIVSSWLLVPFHSFTAFASVRCHCTRHVVRTLVRLRKRPAARDVTLSCACQSLPSVLKGTGRHVQVYVVRRWVCYFGGKSGGDDPKEGTLISPSKKTGVSIPALFLGRNCRLSQTRRLLSS